MTPLKGTSETVTARTKTTAFIHVGVLFADDPGKRKAEQHGLNNGQSPRAEISKTRRQIPYCSHACRQTDS